MALTVNLPSAGLLGISGANTFLITGATNLDANSVYVLQGTTDYTVTLPTTGISDGDVIVLKRVGSTPDEITVASTTIEGTDQTIEITNNQPIRLVYINATFGWLIT